MTTVQNLASTNIEQFAFKLNQDVDHGLEIHDASVKIGQILANSPVVSEEIISHFNTLKSSGNPGRWSRVHSYFKTDSWSTFNLNEIIEQVSEELLELMNDSIASYNSGDTDQFIETLASIRFTHRYISNFKTQIDALKSIHSILANARSNCLVDSSVYDQIHDIVSRDLYVDVSLAIQMALDFDEEQKRIQSSVGRLVSDSKDSVHALVRHRSWTGFMSFEERVAASNLALVDCAHRYNPFYNTAFFTFAQYYVRQALRSSSILYSLPATIHEQRFSADRKLLDKIKSEGNVHSVNEWGLYWLNGNMKSVQNSDVFQDDRPDSTESSDGSSRDMDGRFLDTYDLTSNTDVEVDREEFSDLLSKALETLKPREKEIILGKFINGSETSETLAQRYGITTSRISQIIIEATGKLSSTLRKAGFESLTDLGLAP